MTHWLWKEE